MCSLYKPLLWPDPLQILYQGLKASATQIITVVLAFAVICTGIFILQMSKVDPRELSNVSLIILFYFLYRTSYGFPLGWRTNDFAPRGRSCRSRSTCCSLIGAGTREHHSFTPFKTFKYLSFHTRRIHASVPTSVSSTERSFRSRSYRITQSQSNANARHDP